MMDSSLHSQLFIAISVLSSSFLGSLHCLGMCGPIVVATNKNYLENGLYHLGRLFGYLVLGGLVGLLGREVVGFFPHSFAALVAPIFLGVTFVLMGIFLIRKKRFHFPLPNFVAEPFQKVVKLKKERNLPLFSLLIGFNSIFLPCGWLYGFVIGAAAADDLTTSLLIMFMFWLGTVPTLFLTPVLFQKVLAPIKQKFPLVAGLILILAGSGVIWVAFRKVL